MQTRDVAQRPLSSTYCPFCVDEHRLTVAEPQDAANAFSLSNLLPAGTISVVVHSGESSCPSAPDSRNWYSLPMRSLSTHPSDTLFQGLAFLAEHSFLRAICRLGTGGRILFIRIYLIPDDLPRVHGQLRCRPDTVVNKGGRYMRGIIPLIEQNDGLWDADETCLGATQKHFFPSRVDNRTMAEIYSDLPSPKLNPPTNGHTTLSHNIASGDVIWGLRTVLYGYQRHSVAVMAQKESRTSPVPDPLYITVPCMSGTRCYIQPSTMSVVQECPMLSPSQSGILCEELGTGKTVMIIALVLATAGQLPEPEESLNDERPVMTPLAYRHFPSADYILARDKAGSARQRVTQQVPSLVELLVHYFSLSRLTTGRPALTDDVKATHLWPLIRANNPFYHHYNTKDSVEATERSCRRTASNPCPRTMYLSSSTLVIVPLTLLGQWKSEIDKHCHDCVRYLVVRPSGMDLPDARELALNYELIVMSDTRFRIESGKNNIENLSNLQPCTCPCLVGSRVPDCRCPGDPHVTPLLQVRWKRLVVDEGHNASNVMATINWFVRQLSVQHKWIVTGTPTSNILGLGLGLIEYPQSDSSIATSLGQDWCTRVWGSDDSFNLRKLGTMIGDFLDVPRFRASKDRKKRSPFTTHVSAPLCNRRGPQLGAISVLSQVMQMMMVRHRIEDVEDDVLLPPMKHDIIYMDLDNHALKSYNAMQASLAINAIDSEREGRDYLFHPSNGKELQAAINNSSQSLFWSSSDILYNVDEICRLADKYTRRAVDRKPGQGASPEDLDLLQQALKHAAVAASDGIWRKVQPYPDVPFKVSGLDPTIAEAWTRNGLCNNDHTLELMHPDRLENLRSLLRKQPLISTADLVKVGNIFNRKERMVMALTSVRSHKAKNSLNQKREMALKEVQEIIGVPKKRVKQVDVSNDELEDCVDGNSTSQSKTIFTEAAPARVPSSSPLYGVKVGPSLSTKLNCILSEVQRYSPKEKFLIFSKSLLTLFQISEALSLFEIKHLHYTNEKQYLLREHQITTFGTSDVHRVLLMDLKLGARGLNLISASRVIFCEPVWHPDVELQAIKRVHRIGQTRPVTVKTLVIRSTAEEAMIARRQYLRNSDKVPSMMTESGMRDYLMHPHFLSESAPSDPMDGVVLSLDANPSDIQSNPSEDTDGPSRVDIDTDYEYEGAEVVARKRVRFSE